MNLKDWLIVIPARLASQRLPNKPLADLAGKPLLVRVFENLSPLKSSGAEIIVALDHELTAKMCDKFHVPYFMTKSTHPSGTDRCAEVALKFPHCNYVLNVQGDEPFVNLDDLLNLMELMSSKNPNIATMGLPMSDWEGYQNPNVVKIALDGQGSALYFSRAPIPFDRDAERTGSKSVNYIQHLGVYAFSQASLQKFCNLPASNLEQIEKLEQLRALSAGWKILVSSAKHRSIGIDTPEDLSRARQAFNG